MAQETHIPAKLYGLWAKDGHCDIIKDQLTLTAKGAKFADAEPYGLVYSPEESALYGAEEGEVSNFVYDEEMDILSYNPLGYHMGIPPEFYKRCKAQ